MPHVATWVRDYVKSTPGTQELADLSSPLSSIRLPIKPTYNILHCVCVLDNKNTPVNRERSPVDLFALGQQIGNQGKRFPRLCMSVTWHFYSLEPRSSYATDWVIQWALFLFCDTEFIQWCIPQLLCHSQVDTKKCIVFCDKEIIQHRIRKKLSIDN